jgi:hypothetical protein
MRPTVDGFFYGHLSWHLSLCEIQAGNWEEALRTYRDAIALDRRSGRRASPRKSGLHGLRCSSGLKPSLSSPSTGIGQITFVSENFLRSWAVCSAAVPLGPDDEQAAPARAACG